ncbi:di-trans,poly-cis-decaprenylcistransferase [Candidatus Wolfebacteria bacterium]|nr:di-trans,poly-cis-decaprenylcistransferase [Candidatus Wolfebacteria bacterium]
MSKTLSVGIIMDGNRRWAKGKNLSVPEGHKAGSETLITLLKEYSFLKKEHGIEHYIFYAFSTENWNRSKEEVVGFMVSLKKGLSVLKKELTKIENPPKVVVLGDRSRLEEGIQNEISKIEEETKGNKGTIAIALSYGGRDEIVRAVRKGGEVSEEGISKALDTAGIPDPDIIIRTGGEKRLSNFLLWQAAYSELFFLDTLWPDFTKESLIECIKEYNARERRHGV